MLPWFVVCGLLAGCGGQGGGTVAVSGQVTNAGSPLEVEGREVGLGAVQVLFYRIGPDGRQAADPEVAEVDAQGNFEVPGPDGEGIAPGKYRIAVRQWDPYPQVDKLGGRFDAEHSPIVREVTGREKILIDVSRPEG